MKASNADESICEYSKTRLCIIVKVLLMLSQETHESHLNVTGVQFFRNLTQFRSSEIHYQPDPTARNGSLDIRQPEM